MSDRDWEQAFAAVIWIDLKTQMKRGRIDLETALAHPVTQDRLVIELLCLTGLAPAARYRHHDACATAERTLFLAGLEPDAIVRDLHPRGRAVLLQLTQGPDLLPAPA